MFIETTNIAGERCPQCHKKHLKEWHDLSVEEKFVTERLPMSAEFSKQEREHHLFCPNCWHESISTSLNV